MPAGIGTYCALSRRTAQTLAICALSVALAVLTLAVGQNVTELREGSVEAQGLGGVTVTGVAAEHSSARIYYQPVADARDYRVYDTANPTDVKYAGMVHLTASAACPGSYCQDHFVVQSDGKTPVFPYQVASGGSGGPQGLDVAATDIEWNGLGDGKAHTLVVEAVDQLGPAPRANLYTGVDNTSLLSGGMLGSNKGSTGDGNVSTNGQGPYTNTPHAIARSQPFVVQANRNVVPIPSSSGASQTFLDTFDNAEGASIHQVSRNDTSTDAFGNLGQMTYTMNAGTSKAWTIEYRQANNRDSMPFIASDHFMDMLFDGATPDTSAPTHTIYGSMSMTPGQTVSMANGQIVHLTMEVDAHQSFRRWLAFDIAPASDPLQGWDPNTYPINNTNQGVFLELKNNFCTMDIFTGPNGSKTVPTGTAGGSHGARLWGQAGSSGGGAVMCDTDGMYNPATLSYDGRGLDDRSRLDFFISQTHAALFEDGRLVVQSDIPVGTFPFANQPLKVYFSHYLYHSDADVSDLETVELNGAGLCYAENSYWFNAPTSGTASNQDVCNASYPAGYGFPYSDERHWDNMGFEALPSSSTSASDYSGLSSKVQPPQLQAPQFTSTNSGAATLTPTPTQTAAQPTSSPTRVASSAPPPVTGPANGGGSGVGQWVNVTPSNVNLTSNLDCGNYGVQTVVSDPARASDLYAAFDCQGIWKSTNYGQSWTGPINTGPNGAVAGDCAGGIAIARGAAGHPPILYESCIRGSGTGFWRSTDGGVSWARFTVGPGGDRQDWYWPSVDPYDPNHLLMAAHEQNLLAQSTDGGQTWTSIPMNSGMLENGGTAFLFFINTGQSSSTRNTWLYLAQGTGGQVGTWRTSDGGTTWTRVDDNEHPHGDAQIYQPDTSGVMYMAGIYSAGGWGVLRSTDYGKTWTHVGSNVQEAIVYGTPNFVYSEYGWACGMGCDVPPDWQMADQPGTGGWSGPTPPSSMSQGPGEAAVVYDGQHYVAVTANWLVGLWRYVEGSSGPAPAPAATSTPTPTPRATSTPTATTTATPQFSSTAQVGKSTVARGSTESMSVAVRSTTAMTVLVDVEVYDASGAKVFQQYWDNQTFAAGQTQTYDSSWQIPQSVAPGTYTVKIGVFSNHWSGTNYYWNDSAAMFTIV